MLYIDDIFWYPTGVLQEHTYVDQEYKRDILF